ncbi:hypothetical protein DIJ64_07805 [Mycobacterium leprae]|uniref:RNA polymerase sigma factor 70 region 4 type 2 domain-containing protein n=1 Tax=Mycobacterium leprae TaxID=1769 RepID=A0AAD0P868_MYCLR|nr:hypothetical protein DIJ64_07805 [Mycobacterium leprae]
MVDSNELDQLVQTISALADEDALLKNAVSSALLAILDWLPSAQRVALVLHNVFAVSFETIADLLKRSPETVKKLTSWGWVRGRLHSDPGPPNSAVWLSAPRAWRRFWKRPATVISPRCWICGHPRWCGQSIACWFPSGC